MKSLKSVTLLSTSAFFIVQALVLLSLVRVDLTTHLNGATLITEAAPAVNATSSLMQQEAPSWQPPLPFHNVTRHSQAVHLYHFLSDVQRSQLPACIPGLPEMLHLAANGSRICKPPPCMWSPTAQSYIDLEEHLLAPVDPGSKGWTCSPGPSGGQVEGGGGGLGGQGPSRPPTVSFIMPIVSVSLCVCLCGRPAGSGGG
jgi:hypothetical protein